MKEEVSILVIDDTNQDANIRALELRLKKLCIPHIEQISTGDIELRKDDGSDHLDTDKLKVRLKNKLNGRHIDWIATDFNLGEDNIDGIDVIRIMLELRKFKHKNIILYSGNIQSAIRKVIKESKSIDSNDPEEAVISAVTKFIALPIVGFEGRQDFKDKLIELITQKQRPSLEDRLLKLLRTHESMIFNSCFPPFIGKTFGEIANIIEDESDARSNEWLQALIDQTLAYLLQVNE